MLMQLAPRLHELRLAKAARQKKFAPSPRQDLIEKIRYDPVEFVRLRQAHVIPKRVRKSLEYHKPGIDTGMQESAVESRRST